jgi:hypothetical protein
VEAPVFGNVFERIEITRAAAAVGSARQVPGHQRLESRHQRRFRKFFEAHPLGAAVAKIVQLFIAFIGITACNCKLKRSNKKARVWLCHF